MFNNNDNVIVNCEKNVKKFVKNKIIMKKNVIKIQKFFKLILLIFKTLLLFKLINYIIFIIIVFQKKLFVKIINLLH